MVSIQTSDSINRLLAAGLTDGGTAGLIWGFIGVSCGFTLVYASIAEMASMYVTDDLLSLAGTPLINRQIGPPLPVDSIIGCRSSHQGEDKSTSAILQVTQLIPV
jgi:hypothetical protein